MEVDSDNEMPAAGPSNPGGSKVRVKIKRDVEERITLSLSG